MATLLELAKLSHSFGALKVIDNLDLAVEEGEILGILGPNGADRKSVV